MQYIFNIISAIMLLLGNLLDWPREQRAPLAEERVRLMFQSLRMSPVWRMVCCMLYLVVTSAAPLSVQAQETVHTALIGLAMPLATPRGQALRAAVQQGIDDANKRISSSTANEPS